MKAILFFLASMLICGRAAWAADQTAPDIRDYVVVAANSAMRSRTSAGASNPDRLALKLRVRYGLFSAVRAVVTLALDDSNEMAFSTFDKATVGRGEGEVEMKAGVRLFVRDTLHGMVILKRENAPADERPLAITCITINLEKLKRLTSH
jgi:hypothetical protein